MELDESMGYIITVFGEQISVLELFIVPKNIFLTLFINGMKHKH